MTDPVPQTSTIERVAIAVRGVVQGVGFRPFVYNTARAAGLTGWVRNETDRVRIEIQGSRAALDVFLNNLKHHAPPQSQIDSVEVESIDLIEVSADAMSFEIRPSRELASRRPSIPTDLATCGACLAEIRDPAARRHGYPFTNCTNCGPRWSIIEGLPYDRPRTSMRRFAMCDACRAEYVSPTDRRFHAQPIACADCGPELRLLDASGKVVAQRDEALRAAVQAIHDGQIIAMKGLGGFQLLVDATRDEPVARLRQRKRRPAKPLAVMVGSLDDARRCCAVSDNEAATLSSPAAPIVLLRRHAGEHTIAPGVAPGNPDLGVMLPSTPLHHLLMDALRRPIVCTSGNLSEEPMATRTSEALQRLGRIADLVLTHNRPIVRPVDDSVVRCDATGPVVLRRARGYAPLAIELDSDGPIVLAVGGHLKNAVALRLGRQVVVGSHVGDLDSPLSWDVHRRAVDDLLAFFDIRPDVIACDMHPDYLSTQNAERLAAQWGVPLVRVQHHHAHVAACVAEHQLRGPVLGLAFDGTGYGPDGTVWGGEALECAGAAFRRVAHLRCFGLPGGDAAVRRPRRSALGALVELGPEVGRRQTVAWFTPAEQQTLLTMLERGTRSPQTSSLGRLFDAVAALCGLLNDALPGKPTVAPEENGTSGDVVMSFEGQAAMALEFAADAGHDEAYEIAITEDEPMIADWRDMLRAVLADRASGAPVGRISARFHNALAAMALAIARRAGCAQVVLSGGCFQNRLLTERIRGRLSAAGFNVYTHKKVPPGDGGIALGQAYLAGLPHGS
ncbi:MAG: carbamoyltransferase HypF [Pirellulales bacterium]|nr:carbamoyltransferase HypF [Pirellulales bacterium]